MLDYSLWTDRVSFITCTLPVPEKWCGLCWWNPWDTALKYGLFWLGVLLGVNYRDSLIFIIF